MAAKSKAEQPSRVLRLGDPVPTGVAAAELARQEQEREREAIEDFADRLMAEGLDIPLVETLQQATNFAAYMTAIRNKSMVLGSRYVPAAIMAVGKKASDGNLDAARMLFEYLGFTVKTPVAQVNTQVNVSVPTLRDVIDIAEDGSVVGVKQQ